MTDNAGDPPEPPANDPAPPRPASDPAPVDEFAPLPRKRMWRGGDGRPAAVDRWWQDAEDTDDDEPAG